MAEQFQMLQGATSGIQALHESLSRANEESIGLSEKSLDLLTAVVGVALGLALLPEAAAATGALGALSATTAALSIASSTSTGLVFAFDLIGVFHLSADEYKRVKFVQALSGNPFSMFGGLVGSMIDGDYGMETGVEGGQFAAILYDLNETIGAAKLGHQPTNFHIALVSQEIRDFPTSHEEEHPLTDSRKLENHLNQASMARSLHSNGVQQNQPLVQAVTNRSPPTAAASNASRQSIVDRSLFTQPINPIFTPLTQVAPAVPPGVPPQTTPPNRIPPLPTPAPSSSLPQTARFPLGNLLPDYLGGDEPSDDPPYSPNIPDDGSNDGMQLHFD